MPSCILTTCTCRRRWRFFWTWNGGNAMQKYSMTLQFFSRFVRNATLRSALGRRILDVFWLRLRLPVIRPTDSTFGRRSASNRKALSATFSFGMRIIGWIRAPIRLCGILTGFTAVRETWYPAPGKARRITSRHRRIRPIPGRLCDSWRIGTSPRLWHCADSFQTLLSEKYNDYVRTGECGAYKSANFVTREL